MPLLEQTLQFRPPVLQFNKHLQTVLPSWFRKTEGVNYQRIKIETPDDDFLNIDMLEQASDKVIIISHGFEGSSEKQYARGTAKLFYENGWDVAAWNCRTCNGEMNKQLKMYDHGDIDDINTIYDYLITTKRYKQVALIGWSMGGNISVKFASVLKKPEISHVISVSAPLHIGDALAILETPSCWIYKKYFLSNLKPKMVQKAKQFPEHIQLDDVLKPRGWRQQIELFYCTVNGYKNLEELNKEASALNYLDGLKIPTLLLQGLNDPILPPTCYPYKVAKNHKYVFLETTVVGGHCGFMMNTESEFTYAERRALDFVENF